ncbi:MAG: RecA-superfamily ATPase [Halorubrum sp. J07HR59]|nr:MAG: RecA-superfamily ATPase [Halorubrum sp. J07HR59]
MTRIPFGVDRLDSLFGGGAPAGSVVLLSTDAGAGGRAFCHTSAVINALATGGPEKFEQYYDGLHADSAPPSEVHYISFTAGPDAIRQEFQFAMADDLVETATDSITFHDLSTAYFQLSPVPREWYLEDSTSLQGLGKQDRHPDPLTALGDRLTEHAEGNLVVVDSLTDLVSAGRDRVQWNEIAMLTKGLKKAATEWGGLILLVINQACVTDQQLGALMAGVSGTFEFSWESGGSQRARTMVVREFGGVLSRLEDENIVRFETEVLDSGFDISDIRKIR